MSDFFYVRESDIFVRESDSYANVRASECRVPRVPPPLVPSLLIGACVVGLWEYTVCKCLGGWAMDYRLDAVDCGS